jgi:hypothetical protein
MLVSVRFHEKDVSYLQVLAQEKKKSIGKVLRDLVAHCREENVGLNKKMRQDGDRANQILEQIHLAIPHLIYMNRTVFNCLAYTMDNSDFKKMREAGLEKTAAICGEFQTMRYRMTNISFNDNGLQTLPIDPEMSRWKTP